MQPRLQTPFVPHAVAAAAPQPAALPAEAAAPLRLQRKAGACACGGSCPRCNGMLDTEGSPIQRQLRIGPSDDPLEREADRVANAVTAASSSGEVSAAAKSIQRLSSSGGGDGAAAPADVQQTLSRSGQPLETGLRQDMEQRFGQDFGDVRVHEDATAARSAETIGAQAYTAGHHIVFGSGQYAPQSSAGKHLLAHELTHVVQQAGGAAQRVSRYRRKPRNKADEENVPAWEAAEELTDSKTQPWIASIAIEFTGTAADTGNAPAAKANGELPPRMPTGTLTAKYSTKPSTVPADITVKIVGGSTALGLGLTDAIKTPVAVTRIEGSGYTDSKNTVSDPLSTKKDSKAARYSKSGAGTMNYAVFFKGIQAIHDGWLNTGSHACVHVGDGKVIRQINHHSWVDHTMVTVSYASSVTDELCCLRKKNGNPYWSRSPCGSTKCP